MMNTTPSTLPCPICKEPVPLGATICPNPNCKEDLTSLAAIDTVGRELYKLALIRIKEGKTEEARQLLSAATVYAPADVDVWVVLGKLEAQAKRYEEAQHAWERALQIKADEERALAGIREVKRIQNRRRWSLWGLPIAGALLIFLCGMTGGRQALAFFAPGGVTPSQVVEASDTPQALPLLATGTAAPMLSPVPADTATVAATVTLTPVMCKVTTGYTNGTLNFRADAGIHSAILGVVNEGEMLIVLEAQEDDAWIKVTTPSGKQGFVSAEKCR